MGIVVVRPEEKLPLGILLQPVEGMVGHHAGAPLRKNPGQLSLLRLRPHVIVVSVKAVGKTELPGHRARAHKGGRLEPRRLGERSDGGMGFVENEATHVAQAVNRGICPRHDAGVGRKGERHLRRGVHEQNAARGQRIQVRRLGMPRSVAAQVVGASGIKSNEQDVRVARRGRFAAPARGGGNR